MFTHRILKDKFEGKHIPKIIIKFTNGIPRDYENSMGFDTELEGGYDAILALMDEMKKAIEMFKKDDAVSSEPPRAEAKPSAGGASDNDG